VEAVPFAIAHGLSHDRVTKMALAHTRAVLGYEPKDGTAIG
jgi:hypothetical protein